MNYNFTLDETGYTTDKIITLSDNEGGEAGRKENGGERKTELGWVTGSKRIHLLKKGEIRNPRVKRRKLLMSLTLPSLHSPG